MVYSRLTAIPLFIAALVLYIGSTYRIDVVGIDDDSINYSTYADWGRKKVEQVIVALDDVERVTLGKGVKVVGDSHGTRHVTVFYLQIETSEAVFSFRNPSFRSKAKAKSLKEKIEVATENRHPFEFTSYRNSVLATAGHVVSILFLLYATGLLPRWIRNCQKFEKRRTRKRCHLPTSDSAEKVQAPLGPAPLGPTLDRAKRNP